MLDLVGLVELAQQHTWFMVVLLWLSSAAAYRSLHSDIQEVDSDVETLDENQGKIADQVNRVDQKQDHLTERQEIMLERMGVNAQEIQELREETARLDERHPADGDFFRGGNPESGD